MKFTDLKPGEAYYYTPRNRWDRYGSGERAVLVDGQRYRLTGRLEQRRGDGWYVPDPAGRLVLVELPPFWADKTGTPRRKAVPVAHLRGPYEEIKAALEEATAKRGAEQNQAAVEGERVRQATEATCARAITLGVHAHRDPSAPGWAEVPADHLTAMVEALEEIGWRLPLAL